MIQGIISSCEFTYKGDFIVQTDYILYECKISFDDKVRNRVFS